MRWLRNAICPIVPPQNVIAEMNNQTENICICIPLIYLTCLCMLQCSVTSKVGPDDSLSVSYVSLGEALKGPCTRNAGLKLH